MKYLLLVLLLAGCAHTKYTESKMKPMFLFHNGNKVKMGEDCISFDYFPNICNMIGRIVAYSDSKSKCYPSLSYTVEFNVYGYPTAVIDILCASDLILLKDE